MNAFYHSSTPLVPGSLHRLSQEHDNCGMGAIAHLKGKRSYQILDYALTSVCCMTHRGAVDADMKTGDGSGVLTQIPYPLFRKAAAKFGHKVENDADLAVGVFFFPTENATAIAQIKEIAAEVLAKRGITAIGWREVPVDADALGKIALATRPEIEHLLMTRPAKLDADEFERKLYLCRREIEHRTKSIQSFYMPSFSSRLISYKALAMPAALRAFYLDFADPDYEVAIALYHQRFSTNTFPAWPLGQPFRMMCHNGEINTVEGNRNWMTSREEFFASPVWGDDIELVKNLIRHGESDSASLDHALELLILSGRSPEHAMCMLVPPAYRNDEEISDEVRAFYQYIRSFSEPWDGPAGLVFTDGTKLCASLDRNGLRPSRYKITDDGILYIGSEAGAVIFDDATVIRKGRLGPGQMLSANTATGEFKYDREIKEELAKQKPYRRWIDENRLELRKFVSPKAHIPEIDFAPLELSRNQVAHGISTEELDMVFPPMMKSAQEAVFSMGDDIPLAILSTQPRLLYTYFKQLFAQVTNPPIDPIREWAVMSLGAGLGVERNLLDETPEHCQTVSLDSAILFEHQLEKIKHLEEYGYPAITLDCTWPASAGTDGMKVRLDELCAEAEAAVQANRNVLILSDRATSAERIPIPTLLTIGTVHHHLNRIRKRMRASIVLETGEARDVHQIACCFGFGATAICPYLGYASVRQLVTADAGKNKLGELTAEKAMTNYRKALEKGILKIMSKMGISVLNSYQGAQTFEAIGVGTEVVDFSFSGVPSKIGGVGFTEIAEESLIRHRAAFETVVPEGQTLDLGDPGYNRYRKVGERHVYTTEVIKNFHTYVKSGRPEDYEEYVRVSLETKPVAIKDLIDFVPASTGPIPLVEVESMESIRRRFTTAAMSLGALSPEAHETLAIAMNRIGGKSDSGEGGEDPVRYKPYANGDFARSYIKQVASGRFGVSAYYLVNADELEIKMAQGAKPGEGGQLPGHKVNALIARLRNTQPGVQLISPPPHHDIYSIEDLAQLIHDLKEVNPRARITVKLVAESGVGTVAAGVAKASADNILISGHDGGTGASPLSSTKHAGSPWELGLAEAQQTLLINNLRDRVILRTDGGIRNGRDVVIAAILGAEQFNFGTTAMIAMGCVYVRKCHLNTCPVGIATTDPKFRAKFKGTPEMVINYFTAVADEARGIMARIGVRTLDELIGRPEFLKQRHVTDHPKANTLDLSALLKDVVPTLAENSGRAPESISRICAKDRNDGLAKPALDLQILSDLVGALTGEPLPYALPEYGPDSVPATTLDAVKLLLDRPAVSLSYQVVNTDRNIGTRLSGRIAEVHGDRGLPANSIHITCRGSAGQSFGCFLVSGVKLELIGEANDYVGKGMAAGEIIIRVSENAKFEAATNTICGNTCLYGATGGKLYANGRAGERFAVRNSGATAVVEGIGDHGCEYMTNGKIAILGKTGKNFGAGMSGGTAYVYDVDGKFFSRVNSEMVVALPIKRAQDIAEVKSLIEAHLERTGSPQAKKILSNWEESTLKLVRVIAKEHAELEAAEEEHEAASIPVDVKA